MLILYASVSAAPVQNDQAGTGQADAKAVPCLVGKPSNPSIVYVTDFYLDPDQLKKETILKREGVLKKRIDAINGDDDDPAQKAAKLISVLSGEIVKDLKDAGQKAEYRSNQSGLRRDFMPEDLKLPDNGWLVAGWFEKVDEGNRALSSTVGFGKGSDSIQIEVAVYDLSSKNSGPFLLMGSENAAKKTPGGLITKNPYTIATKYVLSKGTTEKDVKKQGSAIAKALLQYMKDNTVE